MGLDIGVYAGLSETDLKTDEDGEICVDGSYWTPGSSMDWAEQHFPGRAEGLTSGTVYKFEESFAFRAGSYSGYGQWRKQLAKLVGHDDGVTTGPFYELIEFADNEGVIGPIVSRKLAVDFEQFQEKAAAEDAIFWQLYQRWHRAFAMASNNGAVDFH